MHTNVKYYHGVVDELRHLIHETEWVEFKLNLDDHEKIGETISALSNSAALCGKPKAYLIWGVTDDQHEIVGTTFSHKSLVVNKDKGSKQEAESWLLLHLFPKINFEFHELNIQEKRVVLLEISAATHQPVTFKNVDYIRVGSYNKKLKEFHEKERSLWKKFEQIPYEELPAVQDLDGQEVLRLLDYPGYFNIFDEPLPNNVDSILEKLKQRRIIQKNDAARWDITNVGAILFARDLAFFTRLERKKLRIVFYQGHDRTKTIKEIVYPQGYAVGFESWINTLVELLPSEETIRTPLRKEYHLFPPLAIRELVANALIHQDLSIPGTGPMVEIFENRLEITNPGIPMIDTLRFLDNPPISRNEKLATLMRHANICEERGSGIDKVVAIVEKEQLPAPIFQKAGDTHTHAVLFSYKDFNNMDREEKIRACYLHACLRYVNHEYLTNASLKQRFMLKEVNSSVISKMIKDTIDAKLIRIDDPNVGKKGRRYLPIWA